MAKEDEQLPVMRVDSPGGSAFASELIREELSAFQASGKPVVASFGPVAASGGYWISADADAIYAEPTTITGSIGIFGLVPNFSRSQTPSVSTLTVFPVRPCAWTKRCRGIE